MKEMKKSANFRINIGSSSEYEDLLADIDINDDMCVIISQEDGFENLDIEIEAVHKKGKFKCRLKDLEEAIAYCKRRLWELRKMDLSPD